MDVECQQIMVMYGQLIMVMYTGGKLFRISRTRDRIFFRKQDESRVITRPGSNLKAELPHWRSTTGNHRFIYILCVNNVGNITKSRLSSSSSNKSICVNVTSQIAPQLRLHALLPQVRKECRVITRFITSWC